MYNVGSRGTRRLPVNSLALSEILLSTVHNISVFLRGLKGFRPLPRLQKIVACNVTTSADQKHFFRSIFLCRSTTNRRMWSTQPDGILYYTDKLVDFHHVKFLRCFFYGVNSYCNYGCTTQLFDIIKTQFVIKKQNFWIKIRSTRPIKT